MTHGVSIPANIAECARQRAQAHPDGVAFVDIDGTGWSFGQIWMQAQELASGLRAYGMGRGDTISFQLPNWHEAAVINIAASLAGLRLNPITPIYRDAELRSILEDSRSRLIFVPARFRSQDFYAMLDGLRAELPALVHVVTVRGKVAGNPDFEMLCRVGRDEPCTDWPAPDAGAEKMLLYTSGTTGRAKGAIHTHASMNAYGRSSIAYWGLSADDTMLMPSPVTHVTGYTFGMELPFLSGTKVVFMERWDAGVAVGLIDRLGITCSVGASPFLQELIDAAIDQGSPMPSLRLFACGGAQATPALLRRAWDNTERCLACRIYGATEAPMVTKGVIDRERQDVAVETDGLVIDFDIRIVGLDGTEGRQPGEIRVRGPSLFKGYTDPAATREAFDDKGYFRTGDIGTYHDGAITITGRLKDIIIRGGENLSPAEIENALECHPAIMEAAVVAMPHERLGEGVCAFLRIRPGEVAPTVPEINRFLGGAGLARQKFPERLEILDDFPRTPSGKVRKERLRAIASGQDSQG